MHDDSALYEAAADLVAKWRRGINWNEAMAEFQLLTDMYDADIYDILSAARYFAEKGRA